MDDKLSAKTAKFMSLENLYVYGKTRSGLKKARQTSRQTYPGQLIILLNPVCLYSAAKILKLILLC